MKGAPRKLRKSCSLPTCSKTPGECMHCTCDGRCGQHAGGRCGVRREGNGKSCKREGCLRDETCLHSTRATCCHCRNLVSSSNRTSRKRTRTEASVGLPPVVTVAVSAAAQTALLKMEEMEEMKNPHTEADGGEDKAKPKTEEDDDGAASPTSCDALLPLSADLFVDFEICEELLVVTKKPRTEALTMEDLDELKDDKLLDVEQFITPSITVQAEEQEEKMEEQEEEEEEEEEDDDELVVLTPKSLSEHEAYAARRAACNLVVVVEGVQFNLHKHPMLLESQLLNAKARESVLTTPSPVPVIRLPVFPGGVEAFEALCVYAYTGELTLSVDNVASLFCAVQFLNMGFAVASKTRDFLSSITCQTTGAAAVEPLLRVTQDAQALMTKHDSLQVCQQLQLECVDALARAVPLETAAVGQLLSLPIELFLQVTQEMLATRGPRDLAMDTVRQLVVQAELAQLHRTALDAETEKQEEKKTQAVEQSLALLQRSLKGAADEEFRSTGRLAAAVGDAATPDDEDDALFMKMMGEFEMDSTSEDELLGDGPVVSSSGFIDPLSFEPFAFSSRRESSHHRMLSSAFAV